MNKKKLPKAIMRLPDDMQSDAASLTLEPLKALSATDHEPDASPAIAADPDPVAEGITIAPGSKQRPRPRAL